MRQDKTKQRRFGLLPGNKKPRDTEFQAKFLRLFYNMCRKLALLLFSYSFLIEAFRTVMAHEPFELLRFNRNALCIFFTLLHLCICVLAIMAVLKKEDLHSVALCMTAYSIESCFLYKFLTNLATNAFAYSDIPAFYVFSIELVIGVVCWILARHIKITPIKSPPTKKEKL